MRNKENTFYKIISGKVIKGEQIGQSIGFPTANIKIDKGIVEEGTYRINGIIDGKKVPGAGVFLGEKGVFEAHFIDFKGNLYGKEIKIVILYKIRENKKFEKIEDLKEEIKKDIKYIKKSSDYVLTFGTFDEIHLGHQFYLEQAKSYGDKVVTIVAKSENVEKFKGHKPVYNEKDRLKKVKSIGVSDIVHIGSKSNPLERLNLYKPRVICLGYDQIGFSGKLKEHIEKNKLKIKIIRIPAFKEDKFKSSIIKNQSKTTSL